MIARVLPDIRAIDKEFDYLVPDALGDEAWKSNPDIKLGMISYLGVPVSWPDGEIFGTICILDSKRNEYSELYLKLLMQWREVLQSDLRWLTTLHRGLEEREAKIRRLVEANIIGIVIWNLQGQVLDAFSTWSDMTARISFRVARAGRT